MKRPVIAINLDRATEKTYSQNSPWYALRVDYANAIEALGGIPLCLPYHTSCIEDYVALADGFILPGGDFDIHPKHYNETKSTGVRQENIERLSFEITLLDAILASRKPLLAICAGMQLLNVHLGGSLYQDIATNVEGALAHEVTNPHLKTAHPINIVENSKLFSILGTRQAQVNSTHHQAIKTLGKELVASAYAPDGMIEAIELPSHPFAMGVEWHPEYRVSPIDDTLIAAFIRISS